MHRLFEQSCLHIHSCALHIHRVCKVPLYCSRECQVADVTGHKLYFSYYADMKKRQKELSVNGNVKSVQRWEWLPRGGRDDAIFGPNSNVMLSEL